MNPTTGPNTAIVADDAMPTISLTREFDASAAAVFRAHVEPELYARWNGPHELTTTIGHWDARTGGSWAYRASGDDGNDYDFYGSFHEVRPDELIVQTFTFAGFPDAVSLERLTLDDLDGDRCRLSAVSLFDSFEAREAMIASGMETGIREGYAKLDDLLATNGDPVPEIDR